MKIFDKSPNKERNGFMISNKVPAGNIQVVSVNGHDVELDVELRDTSTDWFYWCFRAAFDKKGTYTFRFEPAASPAVGSRGPAISADGGLTWRWAEPVTSMEIPYANVRDFTLTADACRSFGRTLARSFSCCFA